MSVKDFLNVHWRQLKTPPGGMVGELTRVGLPSLQTREVWHPGIGARLALVVILSSALWTGCVTPPTARKDLLAFFETGRTTREEVLLKLGQPSGSFEQERILTYRIGQYGEQGYFIISPKVVLPAQGVSWQNVNFSLVIVFDEQGRLRKHELVRVD